MKELLQVALLSQRPRDASYLSVVGFNSTKRRVESFIVSYVGYRFITAWCMQLNALFCCLWRNVEASCHKHFVIFSHNQHRRLLSAMCHNLRDAGHRPPATLLTTPHDGIGRAHEIWHGGADRATMSDF